MANVGQPRDPVTAWETRVRENFRALKAFAQSRGCLLTGAQIPPRVFGRSGMEHEIYQDTQTNRYWKATFPNCAGFGPFGHYTPAGYLRRMRLSNLVFGDDVQFEGVWQRKEGPSLVISQPYIQPHPVRFVPTEEEIAALLESLGFRQTDDCAFWHRDDGVELGDTHDRNFMRAPDGAIVAIDVQPRLQPGAVFEKVRAHASGGN